MSPQPEFPRPVRLDQIGRGEPASIAADDAERAALARRFGLVSLDRLEADYTLNSEAGGIMARGHLRAALAQPCVATAEPVPEVIDTPFTLRFVPEEQAPDHEETELSEADCDTIFFTGGSIDMGEAVAESLALALNPYPRAPDADAWLKKMGVLSEEEASPFGALAALKDRMGKGDQADD